MRICKKIFHKITEQSHNSIEGGFVLKKVILVVSIISILPFYQNCGKSFVANREGSGSLLSTNNLGVGNDQSESSPPGSVIEDRDSDGIVDAIDNCPDAANQDQADSNSNGVGDVCDAVLPPLTPMQIKANALMLLHPTMTGRQSILALKTPGIDPLPQGARLDVNNNSITLGTGFSGSTFSDWYLEGYTLVVQGQNIVITNNYFQANQNSGFTMLYIYENSSDINIISNDFFGIVGEVDVGSAINQRAANGVSTSTNINIERNRFKHLSDDCMKLAGSTRVIENAIYAFSNVPSQITPWQQGVTYDIDDTVDIFGTGIFISTVNNNSTRPSNGGNGWSMLRSHSDAINHFGSAGPSLVKGNLIILDPQNQHVPLSDRAFGGGLNSGLYPIRNSGGSSVYDKIVLEENVILGTSNTTFYPISSSSGGQPNWTPPTFVNNLIEAGSNGAYFYPNPEIIFGNNYDATDFSLLASP